MKHAPTWAALHENLIGAMDIGALRATVDTLVAISESAGITKVHGLSVRDFHKKAAYRHTEFAIADIADDDPELASVVKARWDEICETNAREREAEELVRRERNLTSPVRAGRNR